jgi:multicomponent Na+:H+ antiporter subunit F
MMPETLRESPVISAATSAALLPDGAPGLGPIVTIACWVALALLTLAGLLASLRLVRGPTSPDRVIALDLLGTLVVGAVLLLSLLYRQSTLLWVALVLALLLFLSTVAFAMALQRRARGDDALPRPSDAEPTP